LESREKNQLLRELYQVKEDITRFKSELNGLAEQMDGMELHLVSHYYLLMYLYELIFQCRICPKTEFVSNSMICYSSTKTCKKIEEIEQDITATQEANVNLQVILERAVHKQKETDVYATRAMKNIHTHLATVSNSYEKFMACYSYNYIRCFMRLVN
jgi:hypothetical protein